MNKFAPAAVVLQAALVEAVRGAPTIAEKLAVGTLFVANAALLTVLLREKKHHP